jgi:hypothetical protein
MDRLTHLERGAGIGAAVAGALPLVLIPMLLALSGQGVELATVAFVTVALSMPFWVGYNAATHARTNRALALAALWFATLLLLVFTGLAIASIGLLFILSAPLALAATVAGSIRAVLNVLQTHWSSHSRWHTGG